MRLKLVDYLASADYLRFVESLVRSSNLESVVDILPAMGPAELARAYANSDAVVMVPKSDGTPVTAIEAMLARRPLILGAVDYDDELFGADAVWRVQEVTPDGVARAIEAVAETPADRLAERLGRAQAAARQHADLRASLSAIEAIYGGARPATAARTCVQCVLDTNDDSSMRFDASGRCSHCLDYERLAESCGVTGSNRVAELIAAVAAIKAARRPNAEYDSIMGVSGGVDSSYACLMAARAGLRPLVVHLDNSWNSELAVYNIESLVTRLGLELFTFVIDWPEFRDLQLAFLRASVIDIEMITDHAIGAVLLHEAARRGIRWILSGWNVVTEGVLPRHWHHDKGDWLNIKGIHSLFGSLPLRTFPHASYAFRQYCTRALGIQTFPILNYLPYDREAAKAELHAAVGWRDYGGKHHESVFTRFYQSQILPGKWGVDKRKAHLSSMICSGQLTRAEALAELRSRPSEEVLRRDRDYVLKKLGLSTKEFEELMRTPPLRHVDFPSYLTRHYRLERSLSTMKRRLLRAPVTSWASGEGSGAPAAKGERP